jgi:hypothetical protein
MSDPTVLTIFSIVFILLGAYNLFTASKRARAAKLRNEKFKWTQQISALVGIEYLLLAWVFLLSNLYRSTTLSPSVKSIILPLYIFFLLAAAIFAGLVIRRGILNARMIRSQQRSAELSVKSNGTSRIVEGSTARDESEQVRPDLADRRRERRKNAAAARRRRAGKA